MNKTLFIVLDTGLITTLSGRPYSLHREDWKFLLQSVECIKDYLHKGYKIAIIANQNQIANGLVTEKAFIFKLELVLGTLERDLKLVNNSIISDYCIDEDSYNYLPKPGMLYELALEYELDLVNSVLLGNSLFDKDIATKAGIKTYISVTDLHYPL